MYRARLKTRTGCLSCRRRRKKCDDRRPRCTQCLRLRLHCEWEEIGDSALSPEVAVQPSSNATTLTTTATATATIRGTDTTRSTLRIADHDGLDRRGVKPSTGYMKGLWNSFEPPVAEVAFSATEEMRHILITGIVRGWDQVAQDVRSQGLWVRAIQLDAFLQSIGQGKVARLAMIIHGLALIQYLAKPYLKPEEYIMKPPPWLTPNNSDVQRGPSRAASVIFWPAVRDRLTNHMSKYANDRFVYLLVTHGLRFIWPYETQSAITMSESTSRISLTDEFLLRVNNLRSFTMTADFLERYPEFRGEAPQLEPSPTFYRPGDIDHLEKLYWELLRRQGRHNQDVPIEPYHQDFFIQARNNTSAAAERRSKPILAITNLLNPSRSTTDP